jgi:ankyrin repeat protein
MAELLLEHGADINAKGRHGMTPLRHAIALGNTAAAFFLRERRERSGHK